MKNRFSKQVFNYYVDSVSIFVKASAIFTAIRTSVFGTGIVTTKHRTSVDNIRLAIWTIEVSSTVFLFSAKILTAQTLDILITGVATVEFLITLETPLSASFKNHSFVSHIGLAAKIHICRTVVCGIALIQYETTIFSYEANTASAGISSAVLTCYIVNRKDEDKLVEK